MTDRQTDRRDNYIDFLRGIAIFLVLYGHSIQYLTCNDSFFDNVLFKFIYSFHMPLFMFVSVYVFYWSCKKRKLEDVLISRFRGIGIPMLVWGYLSFLISSKNGMLGSVLSITKGFLEQCLGIWFLWAVLISSILVSTIFKTRIKSKLAKYFLMTLAMMLLAFLPGKNNNLFVYPFFVIGFAFSENRVFASVKYKKVEPLFLLMWLCLIPLYQRQHYIYTSGIFPFDSEYGFWGQIRIDAYRYAIGFFGTLAIVYIARAVYQVLRDKNVSSIIEYGGRHSLDIYVMQRILLEFIIERAYSKMVNTIGFNFLTSNTLLFSCVITPICALLCFILLSLLSRKIEKNKMLDLVLFGRNDLLNSR